MYWRRIVFVIVASLLVGGQAPVPDRQLIGVVAGVQGSVITEHATNGNRVLGVGAKLYQNDTVKTREDGFLEMLFIDETVLKLGPRATLKLDQLIFNPHSRHGKFAISLDRGIMRFFSGSQPSEVYRVKTPSLTIGIRGTIFDVVVRRDKASTVLLRKGAVTVSNRSGVRRTIKTAGRASTARRANEAPSAPARASAAISNHVRMLDKIPGKTEAKALRQLIETEPPVSAPLTGGAPDKAANEPAANTIPQANKPAVVESILPPGRPAIGKASSKPAKAGVGAKKGNPKKGKKAKTKKKKKKTKKKAKKKKTKTKKAKRIKKKKKPKRKRPPRPLVKPNL